MPCVSGKCTPGEGIWAPGLDSRVYQAQAKPLT